MQKVAFVISILFLLGACQQATLIPDEEAEKYTEDGRGENGEAPKDSTNVDVNVTGNGWDEPINVGFEFGGEEKKGGTE